MSQNFPPSYPTPPMSPTGRPMMPHRGTAVMVMGILSLVLNFFCGIGWILGIIAWVMGNADLHAMDAGTMDPSGRGNAQAGKICGIISVVMAIVGIVFYIVFALLFGAAAIFGASRGHP